MTHEPPAAHGWRDELAYVATAAVLAAAFPRLADRLWLRRPPSARAHVAFALGQAVALFAGMQWVRPWLEPRAAEWQEAG